MGLGPLQVKREDVAQPSRDFEMRLQGFRAVFPQYNDMDAETLVGAFQSKYYQDMSVDELVGKLEEKYGTAEQGEGEKEKDFSFAKKVKANVFDQYGKAGAESFMLTRGGLQTTSPEMMETVRAGNVQTSQEMHEQAGEGNFVQEMGAGIVADLPLTVGTYGMAKAMVGNLGKTALRNMLMTEVVQGGLSGASRPAETAGEFAANVGGEMVGSVAIAFGLEKVLGPAAKKVLRPILGKMKKGVALDAKESQVVEKVLEKKGWFETGGDQIDPSGAMDRAAVLRAGAETAEAIGSREQGAGITDWIKEADSMIGELESATLQRGEGYSISTAPSWFKALQPEGTGKGRLTDVVRKRDVLTVLEKIKKGEELTEKQSALWDAVKESYEYEVGKQSAVSRPDIGEYPTEMTVEELAVWMNSVTDKNALSRQSITGKDVDVIPESKYILENKEILGDKYELVRLNPNEINQAGGTNERIVKELMEKYDDLPPVVVTERPGGKIIKVDGANRIEAAKRLGKDEILAYKPKAESGQPKADSYSDDFARYKEEFGEDPFYEVKAGDRSEFVEKSVVDEAKKGVDETQYFAMQEQSGIDVPGDATVEAISRAEIRSYIDKEFDVPIRKGSRDGGRRKSVMGQYDPHAEVVMEKTWGDVWTESHELAHHLDKQLKITDDLYKFSAGLKDELGKLDYDFPKKHRASEGFAEFIRHDLTVGDAEQVAPGFYRHWQTQLAKDEGLATKYATLKEMYQRYHAQSAEDRVWSQIDIKNAAEKMPIGERARWIWHDVVGKFQNNLKPIDRVVTAARKTRALKEGKTYEPLEAGRDPFKTAEYLKGTSRAKAEAWVFNGTRDVWGNKTGSSLQEIIKPVREQMDDFLKYVVSRRALVLSERDINVGIDLRDASHVFKKFDSPEFRQASDEMMAWADRALDYLRDAGGLSAEQHGQIRALNPFYVALKRHFAKDIRGGSGKVGRATNAVKRIRGGGEPIVNPLEGMVGEVHRLILAADKIRVSKAIADLSEFEGMGRLIQKIDPPMETKQVDVSALKSQLEAMGIDAIDAEGMINVTTPGWEYGGKHNVISIWRDGKREFYQVDKRLHDALQGMETKKLAPVLDFFFGRPARLMRLMTTGLNAGFGLIRNPARDIVSTAVYTQGKSPGSPFRSIAGVAKDVKGSPTARTFIEIGGEMATLMGQDRDATMKTIDKLLVDNGTFKGKVLNVAKHPVDALRKLVQLTEMGPRIGEFETVLKQAEATWGEGHPNAVIEAFNAARDVTVNFSRNGTYGALINQIIPFWNASLQSGAKLAKFAKEHPVKLAVRGASAITVPTVVLYAINKDKEWYKDLPLAYKYNNWFIQVNDETIIRIPKPFELGVLFGGFYEAAMDQATDLDENALSEAAGLMVKSLYPGDLRDVAAVKPMFEVWQNKDWLGRPIESESMRRLEPTERTRAYTSELAKAMSKGMDAIVPEGHVLSPVQIDHLINGYTGGQYRNVSGIGRERTQKSDIPVVGTLFLRQGGLPQRYVNNAYNIAAKVEEAQATANKFKRDGDAVGHKGVLARHPELRYYKQIRDHKKQVTELLKIRSNANEQRRAQIDERLRHHSEVIRQLYRQGVDEG